MSAALTTQTASDIPRTQSGAPYIRNEAAIAEIVEHVRAGHYCTVLGPPYCQKSVLLRDVRARLEATGDEWCVYLNLQEIPCAADEDFLPAFWAAFAGQLAQRGYTELPLATSLPGDERNLQRCLQEMINGVRRDVVLLLDHLERVRPGPMKALLRVLRAIFTERSADAPYRLGVVTANSLSTASLALGETSPFNIAHIVWIADLSPEESRLLIGRLCAPDRRWVTPAGVERLVTATGGDRDLIRKLCGRCAGQQGEDVRRITETDVESTIVRFVESEAAGHPPFQEMIRAVESNPDTLLNVLHIRDHGRVPRRELALDLTADVDDIRLTGAVRVEKEGDQQVYGIRNEIYARYLRRHLDAERVADVLSMAGRWRQAIPHLEHLASSPGEHRLTLLGTLVNAIYTAESVTEACAGLAGALSRAFAIPGLRLYLANPERSRLRLVSHVGLAGEFAPEISLVDGAAAETRAFGDADYQVSYDMGGGSVLLAPLRQEGQPPLGLIAAHGLMVDPYSQDLLGFLAALGPIGRAIGSVIERETKIQQLTALYRAGQEMTHSLDLDLVLESTLAAALAAVPAAQKASLFVWDETKNKLIIKKHKGFQDSIVDVVQLDIGEGGAGWVYQTGEPLLLKDALASTHPCMTHTDHPDNKDLKSTILVPLKGWGRVIGVLCLDNVTACDAFGDSDLQIVSTLGAQAAIAIQNANVHVELYTLGMNINRGTLTPRKIFEQTVQSITRITGASGANMLLLRDTENPESCLLQKPILAVNSPSFGLRFENDIKPRSGGLTHKVLIARKSLWVSNPDEPPGINPAARACGTQAYLCLPLVIQRAVIGVLFVHYNAPHEFSSDENKKRNELSDEIKMISLFANQAALAIESARQREDLEMADSVAWMGIVFSNLAHRITQKAGAIRNTVYGLRRMVGADPAILERLDRLEEYARLVQDIPRGALMPFQEESVAIDLNAFLRQEIPRWCIPDDGIELEMHSSMPDAHPIVWVGPLRLAMVLETLMTNAVRALKQGDTRRRLSVTNTIKDNYAIVRVINTGKEIPVDIRDRLFREPITKSQGAEGAGVGLLIAKSIVRRYGGDTKLEYSRPGETCFSFSLPVTAVHSS